MCDDEMLVMQNVSGLGHAGLGKDAVVVQCLFPFLDFG